jgi:SOS response regulatory protein OraA/RecX
MTTKERRTVQGLLTVRVVAGDSDSDIAAEAHKPDQHEASVDDLVKEILPLEWYGRQRYLAQHGFDADSIRQIENAKASWLRGLDDGKLRGLAQRYHANDDGFDQVIAEWITAPDVSRLREILKARGIEKEITAACYAICGAADLADAELYLAAIDEA